MSQINQDQVIDLSMNIIKDSKRRLLFWDAKSKKGYQINQGDIKWVKAYQMSFVIGVLIFTVLQLLLPSIVAFVSAVVVYFGIEFYFERFYFKNKIPFKVHDKDLALLDLPVVLKQKRSLEIYKVLFVVLLGLIEVGKVITLPLSDPQAFLTYGFLIILAVVRVNVLRLVHQRYKHSLKA